MRDTDADAGQSLAAASQRWNWHDLSQKNGDESSDGKSTSIRYVRIGQQHGTTKPPSMLLHRPATTTQLTPAIKTICTDGEKPVKMDTKALEEFSQLRIADRTISTESLRQEMDGRTFIKLQDMDRVSKDTFTNGTVRVCCCGQK